MIAERVAQPEEVGLSSPRLQRIDALMDAFIARGVISGAVTLIARHGQIGHLQAHGQMDLAAGTPMRTDALFRMASMTKPVIAVAILTLFEEGKLLLHEPVSTYIPEFRAQQVAVANATAPRWVPTMLASGAFHLEPANREITIRDLLTHTAGMGSATVGPGLAEMIAIYRELRTEDSLAEIVPRFATMPLSFQPGSVWEYSGGPAFDTLGHIVELVAGQPLEHVLHERIFDALDMRDTYFHVPVERVSELARVYERGAPGLQAGEPAGLLGLSTVPTSRYMSGGGGLAGTAQDYARFAMMLAHGGELDGQRILGRKTVELMASNHIGDLPWERPAGDMRGYRFGLGVRVLANPAEATSPASPGTFGWGGAFGTNSWIDPREQMVGLMLIQRMPDLEDTVLRSLWPRYQATAYQALD